MKPSISTALITGLPDEVSKLCLAFIPRYMIYTCRVVNKAWKMFLESSEILEIRERHERTEEWLYVFELDPSVTSPRVFDAKSNVWRSVPRLPNNPFTYGLSNYRCVTVRESIYLIGGVVFDPNSYPADVPLATSQVYKFDALSQSWSRMPEMLTPRGNFACGKYKNSIIVAGGGSRHAYYIAGGDRIEEAEILEIDENEWKPLPSMSSRRANCSGAVCGGHFLVFGGYSDSFTVRGILPVDDERNDAEALDLESKSWISLDYLFESSSTLKLGPVIQIEDDLFSVQENWLLQFDFKNNRWIQKHLLDFINFAFMYFVFNNNLYFVSSDCLSRTQPPPIHVFHPKTSNFREIKAEKFQSRLYRGSSLRRSLFLAQKL